MNTAHDLIGRTFHGKFVITDVLGEGAMGIVYRGFDDTTLAEVAIKVLQPSLAGHDELVRRFQREAAATRRVDHEGSVRVLGRGCEEGLYYLVMELLHGRSLGAVLAEAGRLSEARAARLVIQLCGALQVAHERGVVHRDIKPDNVMVIEDEQLGERIKLLDFGIAKGLKKRDDRVEDSLNSDLETRFGALIGTPEYMAPEQCMGREVDERTDVYACGVLLYRMVTGQVPFDGTGAHPFELCQRHIGEAPAPPRARAPWIRPEMEAVILKALRKAPDERHQSAAELRAELTEVLAAIDRIAAERTVPVLIEDVVRSEQVAALAADLAAPVTIVEAESAPTLPRLSADLGGDDRDDSDREPYFVPLRLDGSDLPKFLDAPLILPDPTLDQDRPTAIPAAAQSRLQRYLPTMAVAAVIGAGLGSLFMALVPLLHR